MKRFSKVGQIGPLARTVLAGLLVAGLGGASATFSDEGPTGAPFQVVATGLEKPTGLVVHPQGFLLLTDRRTGVLYRLTPGFTTAGKPAFTSEVLFSGLDEPIGVAVEPDEGLLVAEKDEGRLVRFRKLGEEVFSAVPEPVAGGLQDPRWLAVDGEGSIFVSADGIKKEKLPKGKPKPKDEVLLKIAPDGAFSVIADGFKELRGLALDPAGHLFAGADRRRGERKKHDGTIFKIRLPEGAVSPVIAGGFEGPRDLEFDGRGALFFTAKEIREERESDDDDDDDDDDNRAETRSSGKRKPDGRDKDDREDHDEDEPSNPGKGVILKAMFKDDGTLDRLTRFAGGLGEPEGLAFDPDGNLYIIAGASTARVLRFQAPEVPVLAPPLEPFTRSRTLTVQGHAEPNAQITILGGASPATGLAAATTGAFAIEVSLQPNTEHPLKVFATAARGDGLASRAREATITHDDTPPDTQITEGPSGTINTTTARFAFTATEAGSTFLCQLDGGVFEACTSPKSYPGLTPDLHTFRVKARDQAGNEDPTPAERSFTPETTRPTVSFTVPANAATGVAINQKIAATFSEAMDPLTITTETFTLKQGPTAVAGTVTYIGVTATFTPANPLAPLTAYTATMTTGARDLAGNALAADFSWSFTTAATPDTTRPIVSATVPANAATGVAINQKIAAPFSEAMDPLTITPVTFTLKQGTTAVAGTVTYAGVTATFNPLSTLASNTTYTATMTTGVRDLAGNALASNFVWSFTTGATPNTTPPTVSFTFPPVTVSFAGVTAALARAFAPAFGLAIPGDTTAAIAAGPAPVALGAASTFAVLAGSTVTSTGASRVNGDLGLSPGTAVTGFPPGTVNGTIHAGDPAAAQAQQALTTAYNDAAGRTVGAILVAGNLGGQTLTPGLYKSTSSLAISSGDLTLDAQGDPNAVFIFQMGSTLTTTSGRQVILSGGARAANVFWQVGSSATLGTGSVFKGNILALASITVTTGAAVEGRLLARTGAVTLDSNIIAPASAEACIVANAGTGVSISGNVAVAFSEAMDPLTITTETFTLKQGTTAVAGTVSYAGVTATFTPAGNLEPLTTYTAAVTTGARNLAGTALATGFCWSFTTGVTPDTTRPIVSATVPANAATAVAINQTINAAFSEAMDPLTITPVTFTLKQGSTAVAGTVSYAGVTATFTPAGNLEPLSTYTATMTTGARDLAGNALATDFGWSFTTGATPDTTPPIVSATVPAHAATPAGPPPVALGAASTFAVLAGSTVTNTGPTTINGDLGLSPGTSVTGSPTVNGTIHAADLAAFQAQQALTAAYNDAAGRTAGAILVAGNLGGQTLTPGLYTSTSSLEISSGDLTLDAQGDANAVFIFQMGSTLVTTSGRQVILSGGARAANVFWQVGSSATLGTGSVFKGNILALASITVTTGVTVEGRLLARTAAVTLDSNIITAPTVSVTVLANGATAVPINQTINATFSEEMDPLTITTASLRVTGPGGTAVTGTVAYDVTSKIATLTPISTLAPNAVHTATITVGARDLAGNALAANFVWSFTTAATPAGQAPVALGAASTFAVLAGSTVTNTGPTTINGDLGLSPGTAVTGFPPGTVNGAIHAGDPAAAQAQLDLTTAYNDAAGRTAGAITVAGNLGGQTLTPGLYTSTSSLEISSGDLTLDAQGDANAVFIFQMASTLVTTSGRQVILSGGARAANVFWQVGSSATLGTGSVFKGNILALASITVTTGAAVEGRLLARTGAVTLDSNVIGLAIPADTTGPTVSFTVPANGATGVSISGKIAATFSEAMDPLTISTATFTLQQGTTAVAGTVTYAGVTATFTPAGNLEPLSTYTATVTTAARDLAGNALATDFSWSFTTGATRDTTRPTLNATVPANAATGVAISGKIAVAFSEAMDPVTVNSTTFTLKQGTTAVAGTVTYAGVTATFTPAGNLEPLSTYTATVTTGARDLAGNALAANFSWSFTTGATRDTTRPIVSATVAANGATAVPINQTINATFSEAMDPLTITTASLRVRGPGGTAVTGTVAYDVSSKIATLNPVSDLAPNAVYTATVTTRARDLAGNALAANFVWSFATAATRAGQAPVALGAASTFAVLAASTVTNTGPTTINGDLGLSPGTSVTGSPTVNGTMHVADAAAAQAQQALTAAYNDAAGRTAGAIAVAGNLGGQTLTPGLYRSTSSLAISSGDLTLDAQGDPNAVFIFQMGSTLVTTSGRQVILSGGARAANVFWQVGSSATLGTGSVFKGNILALASITVTTGVAVEGRLLARTAAVTLDSNVIGLGILADTSAPTVSAIFPASGATGVPLSGRIAATFSEVMEPSTISTPSFTLQQGSTAVAGTVSYAGVTAIRAATAAAQAPVALGAASSFAVLAAAAITSTGPTTVNGDLGISPGTAITGFPPGTVNGTIHATDAAAAQAQQDLTTAYNDAAGRTGAITVAGNLGGRTLTPGLYRSTSSLAISSGDLTLDALGDANAVFIFQMGSTLTTTSGRRVILSGGARAANVFWQVGSSATLGTGSVFKGNILALASITVTTGATVEGRLLASTAAVTLDSNVIGLPIPVGTRAATLDSSAALDLLTSAGPAPVALGAATTFAVLAASTVTSTGPTTINGDLGLSPGTSVTGSPTVNGAMHVADAAAAQAQQALTAAYNDAAGRTGAITVAGNLGGRTLTPGLYRSTSSLAISSGDLTLDAQGDPNAVFIFQMGSTLVTTSGRQVILGGGARAANVFWQVGSSATLGTGSVFKGNILALASITVTTGVTVEGRLLARTAAVTLDSNDIRLPISAALTPLTTYTATMTTAARDLAGNALPTDFSWSFTTGATLDTTRPTLNATVPANAATGVAINHTVTAAFSEAMDPATVNSTTFTLKQGTTAVPGTVSYARVTATFTPASALAPLTTYTARITTGARDLAGNALAADFGWSFTTGATLDTIAPTVSATVPADGATAVPINQAINATFSEAMVPLTITTASLRVTGPGGTAVTGTVAYDVSSKIATLNPLSDLAPNAVYTATMTTGARDLAGNALAANFVWSFTTAATPGGQAPVALGAATTFAVLAASTVTNTGPTTVNGDLGLSPGTAVTGFPPGTVNGTIYAADAAAAQAQQDLTTAYNDAAGRTAGAIAVAGNLGGQTLTPGLYTSTSSLEISSGDLTLDAQGDPNAVFIFQMGSTLVTTSGRQVILSGGAQAANVFWQVGSSATLGTGSVFKGNILALASITVTTGATVEGRLLARTAAVTLDTNTITPLLDASQRLAAAIAPSLGNASGFTLLSAPASGGAVTLTDSSITGNVGSSGGPASFTTTRSRVSGAVIAPVSAQVVTDFDAAYAAVQNNVCDRTLTGTLAGITLAPGVYCFDAAATLTGTLTLAGSSADIWIFKIGAALTATDLTVSMANGAQGCNVTWRSGAATTITRGHFKGTILSGAAFTGTGTATTGSTIAGRALAKGATTATNMTFTGCP